MKYNIFTRITSTKSILRAKYRDLKGGDASGTFDIVTEIAGFTSLVINSDIDELTSTCTIVLPFKNMEIRNNTRLVYTSSIKAEQADLNIGDKIVVEGAFYTSRGERIGLADKQLPVFIGYIRSFNIEGEMLTIECEDSMYRLKKKKLTYSFNKITVSELIKKICKDSGITINNLPQLDSFYKDEISFIADDNSLDLGKFKIEGYLTGAQILAKLQDEYKFNCYFKNVTALVNSDYITMPTIYAGLKYPIKDVSNLRILNFEYPHNISKDSVEEFNPILGNSLEYVYTNKEDDLVVVGSTQVAGRQNNICTIDGINVVSNEVNKESYDLSVNSRATKIELNIPSKISIASLSDLIKETWNNYPSSGFKGDITVFGEPSVKIGDVIRLRIGTNVDYIANIKEEQYYVDNVLTSINGTTGFTQVIKIGTKL